MTPFIPGSPPWPVLLAFFAVISTPSARQARIIGGIIPLRNCLASVLAAGHRVNLIDQHLGCQKIVKLRHAVTCADRHLAHL